MGIVLLIHVHRSLAVVIWGTHIICTSYRKYVHLSANSRKILVWSCFGKLPQWAVHYWLHGHCSV